jgi:hypothetical protein
MRTNTTDHLAVRALAWIDNMKKLHPDEPQVIVDNLPELVGLLKQMLSDPTLTEAKLRERSERAAAILARNEAGNIPKGREAVAVAARANKALMTPEQIASIEGLLK